MDIRTTDLVSLFEQALTGISDQNLDEIGLVIRVGDNLCLVHGLKNAMYGELITFEGGNSGIIFNLDEDSVAIFLLDTSIPVAELEVAKRTNNVFRVPVSNALISRIVNAIGSPIDELGPIPLEEYRPVEAPIAGITQRSPVNESLETGILAIDGLVPVGRGQRELIIGNRNTGKTALVIDTIVHQRNKNVLCIYVSIAQRQANLARIVQELEQKGALDYTIIVSADSSEAVLNQYLAPYTACTIAEFFRDQKKDVLIVYDDLSSHAVAYREMSLLLRRAPGREAYPGDVFYLHSRLLERAGKLITGGSITALPIVQIQSDDITAYVPTNLISITDGQIFLDTPLFNQGVRPAVNVELSVSRVGGAAQTPAIKRMTRALRLELAQYHELLDFSQFGTELDEVSQRTLARGARIVELLKQPQYVTYNFIDQSLMLFLLKENFLDVIAVKNVHSFATQFVSFVRSLYKPIYDVIEQTQDISDDTRNDLLAVAQEFSAIYAPPIE
jgi:F-type H+-transporting ATPase subunit alpha